MSTCGACNNIFTVTRLRHRCRHCQATVCGDCSRSRVRKERVCDACAEQDRAGRTEHLEEAVDVQVQINDSLKTLLKERFLELEENRKEMMRLIEEEPALQQEESMGERINFRDLVAFLTDRVGHLKSETKQLEEMIKKETESMSERGRKLGYLRERTETAERNAEIAMELSSQKDRLKATYMAQAITVKALQDRVDMLETTVEDTTGSTLPIDVFNEEEFIGDRLTVFPCLSRS